MKLGPSLVPIQVCLFLNKLLNILVHFKSFILLNIFYMYIISISIIMYIINRYINKYISIFQIRVKCNFIGTAFMRIALNVT